MLANIEKDTALMTDEGLHYRAVGREFASHEFVSHKHEEYARGIVSTNTVEGYYSIFKRGIDITTQVGWHLCAGLAHN